MEMFAVLFILFLIGLTFFVIYERNNIKQKGIRAEKEITQLQEYDLEFNPDVTMVSLNHKQKIAVNESSQKIRLYTLNSHTISHEEFDFNDLYAVDVDINGNTISSISRGEQIGGAVAGGLIAGGVGAIIGGTTAKRIESSRIKDATLKLKFNDIQRPIRYFSFMPKQDQRGYKVEGYDIQGDIGSALIRKVDEWESILQTVINKYASGK
jgi:hypothetical protein